MLGAAQRRRLDALAEALLKNEDMRVEFYAFDNRPYTREFGTGHAICFQTFAEVCKRGEYRIHIANVSSESGIREKVKELTAYLMERGVDRVKIKAQRVRGKYL